MVFYYMYDCNHNSKSRAAAGEPRMIEFEHVYKTYETHNDENVALEDINIHIEEGEFVFILGHSGAGKSTFLKLIQMEEKPTKGKVFINGQDLTRIRRRKVPYLRRRRVHLADDPSYLPNRRGRARTVHGPESS